MRCTLQTGGVLGSDPRARTGPGLKRLHASVRADLAYWCLMAVFLIGPMVPWYALHLVPLITMGSAKINLLDILAACAVLLALPDIVRTVTHGPRAVLWVCAFLAYAPIPLTIGVLNHERFFAIREARALAFYALALTVVAGGYRWEDFRRFSAVYVAGAAIASLAVLGRALSLTPLPGYPLDVPPPNLLAVAPYRFEYLEWTVPIMGFTLSLWSLLVYSSRGARIAWGAACAAVVWYVVAGATRSIQAVIVGVTFILLGMRFHTAPRERARGVGVALACIVVIMLSVAAGVPWLKGPMTTTLYRWSQWKSDRSLIFRAEEIQSGLARWSAHPLLGIGLGGVTFETKDPAVTINVPNPPSVIWRYASTGYEFVLVKMGLVGLILYLGIVSAAFWCARNRLRTLPAGAREPIVLGIVGMTTLLVLNLLYNAVDTPEGAIAFSLFYGMLLTCARGRDRAAAELGTDPLSPSPR